MQRLSRPTALERHAGFFDADGDGSIGLAETRAGLAALGLPAPLAWLFALIVNLFLGRLTSGRWSLRIHVAYIHRGKHPFDTGLFDTAGSVDPAGFAALFAAPGGEARDCLSEEELRRVIVTRGDPELAFGALGSMLSKLFSFLEVKVLLCLAADRRKLEGGAEVPAISRRNLERFAAGKLFPLLARRRRVLLARAGR